MTKRKPTLHEQIGAGMGRGDSVVTARGHPIDHRPIDQLHKREHDMTTTTQTDPKTETKPVKLARLRAEAAAICARDFPGRADIAADIDARLLARAMQS